MSPNPINPFPPLGRVKTGGVLSFKGEALWPEIWIQLIMQAQPLTWRLEELQRKLREVQVIFVSICDDSSPSLCNTAVNIIQTYVSVCWYDRRIHMHEGECHAKETASVYSRKQHLIVFFQHSCYNMMKCEVLQNSLAVEASNVVRFCSNRQR